MTTYILGIETSCDETAAAVVANETTVLSSVVSSQIDLHARFGGVVPEVASRAHLECIDNVIDEALLIARIQDQTLAISGIAVTYGPGLIGALLVGLSTAKALSMSWQVPFVGVNHLEAHLFAPMLEVDDIEWPLVVLLVSGGHTVLVEVASPGFYSILGQTIDDAAGEAFDKVARYLGLGYPGGPQIDRISGEEGSNPSAFLLPRAMKRDGLDFSFSGVKTAVIRLIERQPDVRTEDVAASFQEAVVDVLVEKSIRAAQMVGAKGLCLAGGVAANSALRSRFEKAAQSLSIRCLLPSKAMCTDNAAMVGAAGAWRLAHDGPSQLSLGAEPNLFFSTST